MPGVIHSGIDLVLYIVSAEDSVVPILLSAATSPTFPPHPRAKELKAPQRLTLISLLEIGPKVGGWRQREENLNCRFILLVSRFLTGLQTTFLLICSRPGSCSYLSSSLLPSPSS